MVPTDQYIISPLYRIIEQHEVAAVFLAILGLVFWRARRSKPGTRLARAYRRFVELEPMPRIAVGAMGVSSAVHLGLVFGHEADAMSVGYLAIGVAMIIGIRRILAGARWRIWAAVLLGSSLGAFIVSAAAGTAPDQIAMMTKMAEIVGLTAVLTPAPGGRHAKLGNVAVVGVIALVSIASWIGAFTSGGGHHLGETPPPAVALPQGDDRDPTVSEREAASRFHAELVTALAPYKDPTVAAAAGYDVDGITGLDFHADNPSLKDDGRVMDPAYPETLVYAMGPDGPILLGAMFQMDGMGEAGPAVGGPLTVWHAHDHVCISFTGMTGAVSPFGMCGLGSITIPITNEMIHAFVVDGAPDHFGDLPEDWIKQAVGF